MNKTELEAFAREAAKSIKTEKDLNAFSQMLTKITVEAALNAELMSILGTANISSRTRRTAATASLVRP